MKIVTISICDTADGGVSVSAVIDPPLDPTELDPSDSAAVYLGMVAQRAMKAEAFRLSQESEKLPTQAQDYAGNGAATGSDSSAT